MDLSTRTLVLVNPVSGGGRARRAQPSVADYLRKRGLRADFILTESSMEMQQRAAAAASQGYGCVAALGGDGTFHHVMTGAFRTGAALGCLPAGGGNDIAVGLGIPTDPLAAAHALLRWNSRPVDVLRVNFPRGPSRIYIGAGGIGADAEAAQLAAGRFRPLPGAFRYVAAILWALRTFQPFQVRIEADGKQFVESALFLSVANAPVYGSGVKIAPAAVMDDGLMDLTLVGDLPWTRIFEAVPLILRTGDLRWPEIHRFRARRVRLAAGRAALFHGDGEILGEVRASEWIEIEVLSGAVPVVAPPVRRAMP